MTLKRLSLHRNNAFIHVHSTHTYSATKITNNLNVLGSSTLTGDVTIGNALTSSGLLNIKYKTRIYDINSPFTNYTELYYLGGNEFAINPITYGDKFSVYLKI